MCLFLFCWGRPWDIGLKYLFEFWGCARRSSKASLSYKKKFFCSTCCSCLLLILNSETWVQVLDFFDGLKKAKLIHLEIVEVVIQFDQASSKLPNESPLFATISSWKWRASQGTHGPSSIEEKFFKWKYAMEYFSVRIVSKKFYGEFFVRTELSGGTFLAELFSERGTSYDRILHWRGNFHGGRRISGHDF